MATTVETLLFKFLGDSTSLNSSAEDSVEALDSIGVKASVVGAGLTAFFGVAIAGALKSAGSFEQTTIAFETMLGSARETEQLLNDLTVFAAETPFEMPEIEQAARGLVQFGERGDELMNTLEFLGNAASGTSTSFGEIALIFNQVRGVGKLLTQDFRQLSTRGVLSLQDIAKHYGVTLEAAQAMLSGGKVSFEDLKAILEGLSAEGGRFANLMERQSKSFLGLISTLKDNIGIAFRVIGEVMLPVGKLIVGIMVDVTNYMTTMNTPMKLVVAGFMAIGAAVGVAATAFGVGALVLSQYIAAMAVFGIELTAVTAGLQAATLAAMAFKAALLVGSALIALWIGYKLGEAISNWFRKDSIEEYNKQLQRSIELNQKFRDIQTTGNFEEVTSINETDTGSLKLEKINKAVIEAEKNIAGMKFQLGRANMEVEEMAPTWLSLWQATGDQELTNKKVEALNETLKIEKKHLEDLQKLQGENAEIEHPTDKELDNAMKYNAQLEEQVRFFGMKKDEIQMIKLAEQGISEEMLKQIKINQKLLADKKEEAKLAEEAQKEKEKVAKEAADKERRLAERLARDKERQEKAAADKIAAFFEKQERKKAEAVKKAAADLKRIAEQRQAELDRKEESRDKALETARGGVGNFFIGKEFDSTAEGLTFGLSSAGDVGAAPEEEIKKNTKEAAKTLEALLKLEENRPPAINLQIIPGLV